MINPAGDMVDKRGAFLTCGKSQDSRTIKSRKFKPGYSLTEVEEVTTPPGLARYSSDAQTHAFSKPISNQRLQATPSYRPRLV